MPKNNTAKINISKPISDEKKLSELDSDRKLKEPEEVSVEDIVIEEPEVEEVDVDDVELEEVKEDPNRTYTGELKPEVSDGQEISVDDVELEVDLSPIEGEEYPIFVDGKNIVLSKVEKEKAKIIPPEYITGALGLPKTKHQEMVDEAVSGMYGKYAFEALDKVLGYTGRQMAQKVLYPAMKDILHNVPLIKSKLDKGTLTIYDLTVDQVDKSFGITPDEENVLWEDFGTSKVDPNDYGRLMAHKVLRTPLGIAGDILGDPISWIGYGALKRSGTIANVMKRIDTTGDLTKKLALFEKMNSEYKYDKTIYKEGYEALAKVDRAMATRDRAIHLRLPFTNLGVDTKQIEQGVRQVANKASNTAIKILPENVVNKGVKLKTETTKQVEKLAFAIQESSYFAPLRKAGGYVNGLFRTEVSALTKDSAKFNHVYRNKTNANAGIEYEVSGIHNKMNTDYASLHTDEGFLRYVENTTKTAKELKEVGQEVPHIWEEARLYLRTLQDKAASLSEAAGVPKYMRFQATEDAENYLTRSLLPEFDDAIRQSKNSEWNKNASNMKMTSKTQKKRTLKGNIYSINEEARKNGIVIDDISFTPEQCKNGVFEPNPFKATINMYEQQMKVLADVSFMRSMEMFGSSTKTATHTIPKLNVGKLWQHEKMFFRPAQVESMNKFTKGLERFGSTTKTATKTEPLTNINNVWKSETLYFEPKIIKAHENFFSKIQKSGVLESRLDKTIEVVNTNKAWTSGTKYFDPEIAKRMDWATTVKTEGGLGRYVRKYNSIFKQSALLSGGYHWDSGVDDLFRAYSLDTPMKRFYQSSRMFMGKDIKIRNAYKNLGPEFKDYTSKEIMKLGSRHGLMDTTSLNDLLKASERRFKSGNLNPFTDDFIGYRASRRLGNVRTNIMKNASFMDLLSKGYPPSIAAREVNKVYFNFQDITPFLRGIRDYGVPFLTEPVKKLTQFVPHLMKRPYKAIIPYKILSESESAITGESKENIKKYKLASGVKDTAIYMGRSATGLARFMRNPIYDIFSRANPQSWEDITQNMSPVIAAAYSVYAQRDPNRPWLKLIPPEYQNDKEPMTKFAIAFSDFAGRALNLPAPLFTRAINPLLSTKYGEKFAAATYNSPLSKVTLNLLTIRPRTPQSLKLNKEGKVPKASGVGALQQKINFSLPKNYTWKDVALKAFVSGAYQVRDLERNVIIQMNKENKNIEERKRLISKRPFGIDEKAQALGYTSEERQREIDEAIAKDTSLLLDSNIKLGVWVRFYNDIQRRAIEKGWEHKLNIPLQDKRTIMEIMEGDAQDVMDFWDKITDFSEKK